MTFYRNVVSISIKMLLNHFFNDVIASKIFLKKPSENRLISASDVICLRMKSLKLLDTAKQQNQLDQQKKNKTCFYTTGSIIAWYQVTSLFLFFKWIFCICSCMSAILTQSLYKIVNTKYSRHCNRTFSCTVFMSCLYVNCINEKYNVTSCEAK